MVLWQQGGPGSSGFGFGYLAELGPYQLTADSVAANATLPRPFANEHSWDRVSNLLLFEHPPGTGFSYCVDGAGKPTACSWNDQTQAEAFYATLAAFYAAWPSYAQHELHMIGESYAGLLLPFLTAEIYRHPTETAARQLRALAVGNGCPGTAGSTPEKRGTCNGPYGNYDTQHVLELAHGHSAVPRALWTELSAACGFPCAAPTWSENCMTFSQECERLIGQADAAIGEFNIYNFYDNCGGGNQGADARGRQLGSLAALRARYGGDDLPAHGGQEYPCGTGKAATTWCNNEAVRAAMHMHSQSFYGYPWSLGAGASMNYDHYTGASYDLYPALLQHVPVLICARAASRTDPPAAFGRPVRKPATRRRQRRRRRVRAVQLERRLGGVAQRAAGLRAGGGVAAVEARLGARGLREHVRRAHAQPHLPDGQGVGPHGAAVPAGARLRLLRALAQGRPLLAAVGQRRSARVRRRSAGRRGRRCARGRAGAALAATRCTVVRCRYFARREWAARDLCSLR